MKKFLLALSLLPAFLMAQTGTQKIANSNIASAAKGPDEYIITGTLTGYPDNTPIDLLAAQTGQPEANGKIVGGKFTLRGKVGYGDFKVIAVNGQPPYLSLFLDASNITITGSKENFEKASVKGSPSHEDYSRFNAISKNYEMLYGGNSADEALKNKAKTEIETFINKNPKSLVTPLAILRLYQLNNDDQQLETFYNKLPEPANKGMIAAYLAQVIRESKRFPIGKPLADFTQADTTGAPVSLSSLKGKYVLVDFWASWCGPCRQENPNVVAMYNKYKSKNFTVLGVSLDKTRQPWIDAINNDNLTWTHVSDLQGWNNAVAAQFEIRSIPQSFLLDPQGNVIGKNLRGEALEAKLAAILK